MLLDNNKKQLDGYVKDVLDTGDLAAKMKAFGFDTQAVDGNDIEAMAQALERTRQGGEKPYAIVMDTVKGKGIPDVEQTMANHSMNIDAEQCDKWLADLQKAYAAFGE